MRRILRALLVACLLTVFAPGVAEALTVIGTSVSLRASKSSVPAGTSVTFTGSLRSRDQRCAAGQTLKLYRNGSPAGSVGTDASGAFSFSATISVQTTYTAKFEGAFVGKHPHVKVCLPSRGGATVRICRPHGPHVNALRPFDVRRLAPAGTGGTRTGCR